MIQNGIQDIEKETLQDCKKEGCSDEQSGFKNPKVNSNIDKFPTDDPKRWFGALPSSSLRLSQVEFKKALDSIISILNYTINLNFSETRLKVVSNK